MRLKLYEDAINAKAQKKASRRNSRRSPTPQDEPTDADAEVEAPGELPNGGDLASLAAAMSRESPSDTSRSSKHGKSSKPSVTSRASHGPKDLPKGDDLDELSASATQARTEMVQKVLEGLREEAFELARDIGVDVLTQPGGLRKFVKKLRDVVFPRASEEARELFKAGQKPGSLARQNGESMLSYVSRRRRWWKLLKTLDGSIELSEPMRVELLLELSGLSRQEIIVIKACAPDAKSFESVAATLVEQYSGVHLREGRSLGQPNLRNSGNLQSKSSRPSGYRPKGKGKTYRAYTADAWYEEDPTYPQGRQYLLSPRTLLVGPLLCHQDPVPVLDRGSRQHHRLVAWWNPLNRLAIRRRLGFGETVHSKLRHDCKSVTSRSGSRARRSWT